jgi:hypothetical protein
MADTSPPSLLLELPDPCLLAVLQCLADDPASLFSAARAHSRLHQAAVVALSRITVTMKTTQQQYGSLLPYLGKHGQHVDSMAIQCGVWHQLPDNLQLTSLQLDGALVQLQPGNGFQGVLRPGLPLKQLRLNRCCTLLDEQDGVVAALQGLPALEHFTNQDVAAVVWRKLQQLTYLDLYCEPWHNLNEVHELPLQPLTRLVDLRVCGLRVRVATNMMSGLDSLTHLALSDATLEPAGLAGKTLLQHLQLPSCSIVGGAAGVTQLLSQLQHLTQLTHLDLTRCWRGVEFSSHPVAA